MNARPLALAFEHASDPVGAVDPRVFGQYPEDDDEQEPAYAIDGDVAVVSIDGLLLQRALYLCGFEVVSGYDSIGTRLRSALADERVGAVVLAIDSPGGECAGCAELASAIIEWSEASDKPIEAYAGEMAASAAYWLASSAGGITVPRTGRVGSIGTVAVTYNIAGELAANGRRTIISASPAGKALGHRAVLTEAGDDVNAAFKARMDRVNVELTGIFAGHVAERRRLSVDDVLMMDADMFMGQRAIEKRLADRVGGISVAIERARARIKRREYSMGDQSSAQRAGASLLAVLKAGGFSGSNTAEAPHEDIEAASKEAVRLAELGRSVEALTGVKGQGALETVKAWQDGHARVAGLENRVKVERLRGRDSMRVPPSAAFAQLSPDAKLATGQPHPMVGLPHPDAGPHADYARMSLAVFDARLDAAPLHPMSQKAPTSASLQPSPLSDAEKLAAQKAGVTEAEYQAGRASLNSIGFGG